MRVLEAPEPVTGAALYALMVLRQMINPPAGSLMADAESAARVYTIAAGKIEAAAADPIRVPAGQLRVYREILRAAAKRSFQRFRESPHPPDPALAASLDALLQGGAQPIPLDVAGPPAVGAAAQTLARVLLNVPPGAFNSVQKWLRAMAEAKKRGIL
jgi:hypothetical protein